MENIDKEKNIGEIKKRDILFPASIIIAALFLSFAWVYTSGLETKKEVGANTEIKAVDSHGHEIPQGQQVQQTPRRSAGCGV